MASEARTNCQYVYGLKLAANRRKRRQVVLIICTDFTLTYGSFSEKIGNIALEYSCPGIADPSRGSSPSHHRTCMKAALVAKICPCSSSSSSSMC